MMKNKKIAILGMMGVPANYGGFEALAENLVKYHDAVSLSDSITVYCKVSWPHSQVIEGVANAVHLTPFGLMLRQACLDPSTALRAKGLVERLSTGYIRSW